MESATEAKIGLELKIWPMGQFLIEDDHVVLDSRSSAVKEKWVDKGGNVFHRAVDGSLFVLVPSLDDAALYELSGDTIKESDVQALSGPHSEFLSDLVETEPAFLVKSKHIDGGSFYWFSVFGHSYLMAVDGMAFKIRDDDKPYDDFHYNLAGELVHYTGPEEDNPALAAHDSEKRKHGGRFTSRRGGKDEHGNPSIGRRKDSRIPRTRIPSVSYQGGFVDPTEETVIARKGFFDFLMEERITKCVRGDYSHNYAHIWTSKARVYFISNDGLGGSYLTRLDKQKGENRPIRLPCTLDELLIMNSLGPNYKVGELTGQFEQVPRTIQKQDQKLLLTQEGIYQTALKIARHECHVGDYNLAKLSNEQIEQLMVVQYLRGVSEDADSIAEATRYAESAFEKYEHKPAEATQQPAIINGERGSARQLPLPHQFFRSDGQESPGYRNDTRPLTPSVEVRRNHVVLDVVQPLGYHKTLFVIVSTQHPNPAAYSGYKR